MKENLLNWVRSNIILIGLLIVAFFFLRQWGTGYFEYKKENKALSDSIAVQEMIIQSAKDREAAAQELIHSYELNLTAYQDSLNGSRMKYNQQKQYYAKRIADLSRIPTDTLYRDVTGWLNRLSANW